MFNRVKYKYLSRSFELYSKFLLQNHIYKSNASRRFLEVHGTRKSNIKKTALIGLGGAAVVGSLFALRWNYAETKADLGEFPDIKPSWSVTIPDDKSGLKLTLFQYQTCPFCCKVRAFLNYYGISYNVVEVNPVLRQQIQFSKWKKVPILLVEDQAGKQQLNDSSMIISGLRSFFLDKTQPMQDIINSYPVLNYEDEDGKQKTEIVNRYFIMFGELLPNQSNEELSRERKWRQWADQVLVHTLSPNVYREPGEALQAFKWFSEVGGWEQHFSAWERYLVIYVGAMAMYIIGKRLKKRHGLKDDVRESLYDACRAWLKEIGHKNTFHGGNKPNLADLAVFGVLSAIEGCEAFHDVKKNTNIVPWYERMKQEVMTHHGSQEL